MKITTVHNEFVMVAPETVEECGVMLWLSNRFKDKKVELTFDTTMRSDTKHEATFWIRDINK